MRTLRHAALLPHTSCSTALATAPQSTAGTGQLLSRAVAFLPVWPASLLPAVSAQECFLYMQGLRLLHDLVNLAVVAGREHSVCACIRYSRG